MNRFAATTDSEAVVPADRAAIWAAITAPEVQPRLTPLLRHITVRDNGQNADGALWRWELTRIPVLGVSISPSFTERMRFDPPGRIDYAHEPPPGRHERTSAEGWYVLTEVAGGTHLRISLTVTVELPLARAAAPAVRRVMETVMAVTGDRFADNLMRHLSR